MSEPAPAVNWRRNLLGLWVAQFAAFFGFSLFFPFIPLYLTRELGLHDPNRIAFWSGLAASASGFSMAIFGPIWGALADRFGRRQMVLRAMAGSALVMFLMALVQTPAQLVGARFLFGVTTGTMSASTALIAAETPALRVGWALGILSTALGLGRAIGPVAGGFMSSFLGLRTVFVIASGLLLVAVIPVMALVREGRRGGVKRSLAEARQLIREQGPGSTAALGALIAGNGLLQFSMMSAQQLVVIRLISLDRAGAALATGIAFAGVGIALSVAAAGYSRLIPWLGYRRLTIAATLLMALSEVAAARAPSVAGVVVAVAVLGLLYGAAGPSLSSMVGLEAPSDIKATVFGLSAASQALGTAFGPLTAGTVASGLGVPAGLLVSAAGATAIAVILIARGREPAVAEAPLPKS